MLMAERPRRRQRTRGRPPRDLFDLMGCGARDPESGEAFTDEQARRSGGDHDSRRS